VIKGYKDYKGSGVTTNTFKYAFKKGQQVHLDEIYQIQGLGLDVEGVGRWWRPNDGAGDENLTITRDITISIQFRTQKDLPAKLTA